MTDIRKSVSTGWPRAGVLLALLASGVFALGLYLRERALKSRRLSVALSVLRALVLVLLGENNVLRQRDRDRATDVAGSGSLAALKTAWAARAPLADRTAAQARTAIRSAIDADA